MPTIRDVARRAGVAPSTVSYALSGKRSISETARARIAKAIQELDFTPSALGRQLAHSRSNMVGLVFPVPEMELPWETLDFIPTAAAALQKQGYGLSVFTGHMTPHQILNLYRENKVGGLILMQVTTYDERVEILRGKGYPLVLIGRCANTAGLTVVDYATDDALVQIFEYLAQLGHRRVGYLDIPHHKRRERLGYARLIQDGLDRVRRNLGNFNLNIVREEIDGTIEDGARGTHALLQADPHITAIVTVYGNSSVGALRALHQHQRRVPEDCSLIGVSRRTWANWSNPQLTSSDIPLNDMVQKGASLILQQLAKVDGDGSDFAPQEFIFPAKLVVRESTAPIPLKDGSHLPWLANSLAREG